MWKLDAPAPRWRGENEKCVILGEKSSDVTAENKSAAPAGWTSAHVGVSGEEAPPLTASHSSDLNNGCQEEVALYCLDGSSRVGTYLLFILL